MRWLAGFGIAGLLLAGSVDWIASAGGRAERNAAGAVTSVNLRASWVTDGDLLELARLPELQRLDLSQTRITDQGLTYLKTAPQLREVTLAYAEKLGDPVHATLRKWTKLTKLSLRGTVVADETAAAAASLPLLETLDIADSLVGDVGMDALSQAPRLKHLEMGNIRASDVGFQALRQFTTLEYLDLGGGRHQGVSSLSEGAVAAVASLRQLKVLRLGHVKLPPKSIGVLAALENLQRLGLEHSPQIGDEVVPVLAGWKSLRIVDLHGTKVTAAAVEDLRRQRPDCKVLFE